MTDDGWIEWKGGECPVAAPASFRVRGSDMVFCISDPSQLNWGHDRKHPAGDIIAYRIVNEETP